MPPPSRLKIKLAGEARSPAALPLLTEQLVSTDQALRDWAARGLDQLGTREARQALYWARVNRWIT